MFRLIWLQTQLQHNFTTAKKNQTKSNIHNTVRPRRPLTWFGRRWWIDGVGTDAVRRRRRTLALRGDVAKTEQTGRMAQRIGPMSGQAGGVGQMRAGQSIGDVVLGQEFVQVGVLGIKSEMGYGMGLSRLAERSPNELVLCVLGLWHWRIQLNSFRLVNADTFQLTNRKSSRQ